jgi:hypothetical protein
MKNLLLLSFSTIVLLNHVNAQVNDLVLKKNAKGFYVEHTVAPKEGLYSVGRLYNVNPKFIALFNGIDLNRGLNIGQVIQIPLTDTNFSQKTNKGVPVYHVSQADENLMKVSNAANKVLLKDLRAWNKLTNDNIAAGSKLIVGFLQSKEMKVAAAKSNVNPPATPSKPEVATTVKKDQPVDTKPIAKPATPDNGQVKNTAIANDKMVTKTNNAPVTESKDIEKVEQQPDASQLAKDKSPLNEKPVEIGKTEPAFAKDVAAVNGEQGYFKKSFDQQVKAIPLSKSSTVTSGIFKTASGWQDGKFYLLIDGVPTGTIIKIVNPDNNKAVYAKVLGQMNGIRQNQGLDIRMSNAAASNLGIGDTDKFVVKLSY